MATTTSCTRCGGALIDGRCQQCDRDRESTFVHREIVVLAMLCVLVAVGFVLTRAAAGANRSLRLRDAADWYERGQQRLAGGDRPSAITALRRATALDGDNRVYQLALAAGLAASEEDTAARQVLLRVRESAPEDPDINVRLARLAVRQNDPDGAVRYYQNALYGSWAADAASARRQVRIELIRYLLDHQQRGRALSELLVLSANLPDSLESHTLAGQLFVDAGDPGRALDHFRAALRIDPANEAALAGAGEAAFEAGDYAGARRYLRALAHPSSHLVELGALADLVLSRDPLRPGLSLRQRQQLITQALARAVELIDLCAREQPASSDTFASLRAEAAGLEPQLAVDKLRSTPESIDFTLDLIARVEELAAGTCAEPTALDRALILIGRRHQADRP